jgi:hypothetical protein
MNELLENATEFRAGEKRPADQSVEHPSHPQALSSPPEPSPKKKRPKLDTAAQNLLTEVFALQDTLSDNEIEALARKVRVSL